MSEDWTTMLAVTGAVWLIVTLVEAVSFLFRVPPIKERCK